MDQKRKCEDAEQTQLHEIHRLLTFRTTQNVRNFTVVAVMDTSPVWIIAVLAMNSKAA